MSAAFVANAELTGPLRGEPSPNAMTAHGVEIWAGAGAARVLEGDWQSDRRIVLGFGHVTTAPVFDDSPQYAAARQSHRRTLTTRGCVVDGADQCAPLQA